MMTVASEFLSARALMLDLGGIPRIAATNESGLAAFKAGQATHAFRSYLCGIDLMPDGYRP